MTLALSTAWNYAHAKDGKEIIQEVKKLGFEKVELNFSLTEDLVKDILELVNRRDIEVSSVHNFCPIPEGLAREIALPDCFNLASKDETQRQKAVFYTKKSIDTAKSLKAKAVVLHCGRNEIPDHTRELIGLNQKGLKTSAAFQDLKLKMQKDRNLVSEAHLRQLLKSMKELANYALDSDVALGIENRFYYREIPSVDEIGILLEELKGFPAYYWHDAGHARIFEDLGLVKQNEYLNLYHSRMLGLHLHNVLNGVDHQSPNKGEIDFRDFIPYIKKDHLKVIESHSPLASAQDLVQSKHYLEEVFNGKI